MPTRRTRLLVLCKTYPSPSAHYVETSCVAAMDESGQLLRLYPVPFRFMQDEAQFKKWQWIEADIEKSRKDHRPESHQIRVDNLEILGKPLSTNRDWRDRRVYLDRLRLYTSFAELDGDRIARGVTLGLLKPTEIVALEIEPARNKDWTDEEHAKLRQAQNQGSLFTENDQDVQELRKLPFDSQNLRLGGGSPVLECYAEPRYRLGNLFSSEVLPGVAAKGFDVSNGNSASVRGPVAHR